MIAALTMSFKINKVSAHKTALSHTATRVATLVQGSLFLDHFLIMPTLSLLPHASQIHTHYISEDIEFLFYYTICLPHSTYQLKIEFIVV